MDEVAAGNRVGEHFRGGEGEPLVLLHGGFGTWRVWEAVCPLLVSRHDVFAPTLPGHFGGPGLPERPATLDDVVDGVEDMLDAAGIERPHVAGNSLGGWIAGELARRGRVRSVVALSPAGGWERGEPRINRLLSRMTRTNPTLVAAIGALVRPAWLRRLAFTRVAVHGDRISHDLAVHLLEAIAACPRIDDLLTIARQESFGDLGDVDIPFLIGWAETDRVLPERDYAQWWRDAVPNAEYRILPDVGHGIPMDDPALTAETILDGVAAA